MKKISKEFWQIIFFIGIAYIVGFALQMPYYLKGKKSLLVLTMWVPTFAVFFTGKLNIRETFGLLKRVSFKYIFYGFFIWAAFTIIPQVIVYVFNLGIINHDVFSLSSDGKSVEKLSKMHLLFGDNKQGIPFFIMNLLITVILASFITTLIGGLGEEIGWRGFLLRKIRFYWGAALAPIIVGLIWAYWHIPANLGGLNGTEHIIFTTFISFPINVIGMSLFLSWIFYKSHSIWPVAFVHGFNNVFSGIHFVKASSSMVETLIELCCSTIIGAIFFILIKNEIDLK